jgi:hypothetical protein
MTYQPLSYDENCLFADIERMSYVYNKVCTQDATMSFCNSIKSQPIVYWIWNVRYISKLPLSSVMKHILSTVSNSNIVILRFQDKPNQNYILPRSRYIRFTANSVEKKETYIAGLMVKQFNIPLDIAYIITRKATYDGYIDKLKTIQT